MRRVIIRKPGHYDRLEIIEEHTPTPPPGHVLVKVAGAGVNYADCIVRMGLYSSASKYVGWPITPGFEVAGTIEAVGSGVSGLREGDRVIGVTRFGGCASHVVLPPNQVFGLPAQFSLDRGATFPAVHLTAWYALAELSRPRPGYTVLVHSAAGGVGTAALGICKKLGLRAIGVVGSAGKIDAALAAGATAVIDRSHDDWAAQARHLVPEGYDLVLESSGVATMRDSYRLLKPCGRLLVFGLSTMLPRGGRRLNWLTLGWHYLRIPRFSPFDMIDQNKTVAAFNLSYLFDRRELLAEAMSELLQWASEGALPSPPIRRYPLDRVADAHRDLESGTTVGKLVLVP